MTRKTVLRRPMAGLRAVTWTGWAVAAIVVAAAVLAGLAGWIEAGVVAVVGAVCLLVGVGSVLGGSWAQVSILLGSVEAEHDAVDENAAGLFEDPERLEQGPQKALMTVNHLEGPRLEVALQGALNED